MSTTAWNGSRMISRTKFNRAFGRVARLSAVFAATAALAVGTLGFASVAGAAGTAPKSQKPPARIRFGANSSPYLAGYQVTPTGGLASASATFTVPAVSCTAADIANGAEEWTGVYTDTFNTYAFVYAYCTESGPAYGYQLATESGDNVETGAAPGDVVVTSLFQSGGATWAEIHDLTNGMYWYDDNTVNQGDTVVDIGTDNLVGAGLSIPTFKKIKFTNTTVNGDYLGFDSPTQFNAVNGDNRVVIQTGNLTTSTTGSSFTVTFKQAS
jgi:hypothetical protein